MWLVRELFRCKAAWHRKWATPGSSHSANTSDTLWPAVESVQRTDLLPELLRKMGMLPMSALSVLKHVHLTFCTMKWIVRDLFRCKAVWHRKGVVLTHFLNVHHRHKIERISLRISPYVTPSLGIMVFENYTDATKKTINSLKISWVNFFRYAPISLSN